MLEIKVKQIILLQGGKTMTKKSNVLRKKEYEERVMRRHVVKKSALLLLSVVLIWLAVWYEKEILFRERSPEGQYLQARCEREIESVMLICLLGEILLILCFIWYDVNEKYKQKIAEFGDLLKEEEFFQYLGNQKLEVELQLDLRMASKDFIETIKNPKIKYYVQREGMDLLYMTAYKGSKKVWSKTVDYKFFNLYFEEAIHH